jgi:hypothetical protein
MGEKRYKSFKDKKKGSSVNILSEKQMAAEFLNQSEFHSQKQLTYNTSALPWISL